MLLSIVTGSMKGIGGFGSVGKASGLGTGLLGKLGIILFLSRLGLHGVWGVGAFFLMVLIVIVGIFYTIYRYRMGQI